VDAKQVNELLHGNLTSEYIIAALIAFIVSAAISGFGTYLITSWRFIAQYEVMKKYKAELTRLEKEVDYRLKGEAELENKLLTERLQLVLDIEEKLADVKDNFGRFRADEPVAPDFIIINGDSVKLTLVNRMLNTKRALLGEDFYILLERKYEQAKILWQKNIDWPSEMATWEELTKDVHNHIERVYFKRPSS